MGGSWYYSFKGEIENEDWDFSEEAAGWFQIRGCHPFDRPAYLRVTVESATCAEVEFRILDAGGTERAAGVLGDCGQIWQESFQAADPWGGGLKWRLNGGPWRMAEAGQWQAEDWSFDEEVPGELCLRISIGGEAAACDGAIACGLSEYPAALTGVAVGHDAVYLTWDSLAGADSYQLEHDGGIVASAVTGTVHTQSGLKAESVHTFRVRGLCACGAGPWSDPVNVLTEEAPEPVQLTIRMESFDSENTDFRILGRGDEIVVSGVLEGYGTVFEKTLLDVDPWAGRLEHRSQGGEWSASGALSWHPGDWNAHTDPARALPEIFLRLSGDWGLPQWWIDRGVIDPAEPPESTELLQEGRLKHLATQAYQELQAGLPGGAGVELRVLIESWQKPGAGSDDSLQVDFCRLKEVAEPFYNRLIQAGYTRAYPWEESGIDCDESVPATMGQALHLFAFDLSGDLVETGLPDWWQMRHFDDLDGKAWDASPSHPAMTLREAFLLEVNPKGVVITENSGDPDSQVTLNVFTPLIRNDK